MRKLRIIDSCLVNRQHAEAGSLVLVDAITAADLLANGRAVVVVDGPAQAAAPVEHRDPEPLHRDHETQPMAKRVRTRKIQ